MRMIGRISVIVLLLCILPFVSAYSSFYYFDLQSIVNSLWFRFTLIFLLFYAILMFPLNRVLGAKNKGMTIIIAIVCSLLISSSFVSRGFLDGYLGNDIVGLIALVGFLFVFGIVFRWFFKTSKAAAFFMLFIIWFFLFMTEPYEVLPYFLLTDSVETIYRALGGWIGLGLLLIAGLVGASIGKKRVVQNRNI